MNGAFGVLLGRQKRMKHAERRWTSIDIFWFGLGWLHGFFGGLLKDETIITFPSLPLVASPILKPPGTCIIGCSQCIQCRHECCHSSGGGKSTMHSGSATCRGAALVRLPTGQDESDVFQFVSFHEGKTLSLCNLWLLLDMEWAQQGWQVILQVDAICRWQWCQVTLECWIETIWCQCLSRNTSSPKQKNIYCVSIGPSSWVLWVVSWWREWDSH